MQDVVATLEDQMRPLVQAELSVLVDVLHRPELLFPPGTEARKKCETGGFISRLVLVLQELLKYYHVSKLVLRLQELINFIQNWTRDFRNWYWLLKYINDALVSMGDTFLVIGLLTVTALYGIIITFHTHAYADAHTWAKRCSDYFFVIYIIWREHVKITMQNKQNKLIITQINCIARFNIEYEIQSTSGRRGLVAGPLCVLFLKVDI